jgi:hypothetical protein
LSTRSAHSLVLAVVSVLALVWCAPCYGQDVGAASGSSSWWFDWSDFRAYGGGRAMLGRLMHASVIRSDKELDLKSTGYAISKDPEPFREIWAVLYIDRLGIRVQADSCRFLGRNDTTEFVSELNVPTTRIGLDLDVIRYPNLRIGGNFDFHVGEIEFIDRVELGAGNEVTYRTGSPITIGVHGRAIPFRMREIPFMIQARGRVSVPFVNRTDEARITDIEFSGGLRPNIWDTSLLGHSTFSVSVELGYRWIDLDAKTRVSTSNSVPFGIIPTEGKIKARWQGAFIQAAIFF